MPKILDALNWCIRIANDNSHGYDQEHRQSPDYDCSSFISNGLKAAGFNISKDSYTGNLYQRLTKIGFKSIPVDSKRQAADIFLTPNHHVVMCVDENRIVHASGNEKGKIKGGQPGDQTGKEICIRSFYTPSYKWKYHLRYSEETKETVKYTLPKLLEDIADGKYKSGDERKKAIEEMGLDYKTVQYFINAMLNGGIYAEHK